MLQEMSHQHVDTNKQTAAESFHSEQSGDKKLRRENLFDSVVVKKRHFYTTERQKLFIIFLINVQK